MNSTLDDTTADFVWLERELLAFIDERDLNGVMPSLESLHSARRQDLLDGLQRHGGRKAVAERLGLGLAIPRKPYGTWQQPGAIDRELLGFIAEHGAEGKMPSRADLAAAGRVDLALAISRGGGVTALSKRLGLKTVKHAFGYWEDPATLEREVRSATAALGHPEVMPSAPELLRFGRADLKYGIDLNGGFLEVANRLGLEVRGTSKRAGALASTQRKVAKFAT